MRAVPGASILILLAAVAACAPNVANEEADKEKIQAALEAYLPLLAGAYASGDLQPLHHCAAEKEVARVHKRIEDLAANGRRLVPVFRRLTLEKVNVWNYSNAYVTTLEVWDLELFAAGSDQVLSQEFEQPNRVQYQLKRDQDRWRVLFRTIQE